MQEEYEETKREVEMQKKRMDLLDVALKENNMQLAAHAQQEKKLQEEVCACACVCACAVSAHVRVHVPVREKVGV